MKDTIQQVTADLEVQMFNGATSASTNTLSIKYKIMNNGTTPIDLTKVKLRYYYTIDSTASQSFWCDWASVGSSNITGSFTAISPSKPNANYYFETGFTTGTIAPGSSVELQIRVAKDDWSNYNQANDYSFKDTGNSYAAWSYVTAYVDDVLSWGMEP